MKTLTELSAKHLPQPTRLAAILIEMERRIAALEAEVRDLKTKVEWLTMPRNESTEWKIDEGF